MFFVARVIDSSRKAASRCSPVSLNLSDGTPQALGPAIRDGLLSSMTSVCRVTESVRNSYNSSTSTRHLLSSRSRAYSPTTTSSSASMRALTHIATPPLPPCSSRRTPSAPLFRLPSAAPVMFPSCSSNSPPSSGRRPKSSSHYSSISFMTRLTLLTLNFAAPMAGYTSAPRDWFSWSSPHSSP
ncbi:hypothetical protein BGY98DRAFT_327030 [Russula aff. rugulosa BPL654]|nr:hypothetical protein BGY98DRAFT_327030 [Russula aff. rugulosa BPL654]